MKFTDYNDFGTHMKSTTIDGYLTSADQIKDETREQSVQATLDEMSTVYIFKGSCNYSALPTLSTEGIKTGWVYNITDDGGESVGIYAGDNVAAIIETSSTDVKTLTWDKLAASIKVAYPVAGVVDKQNTNLVRSADKIAVVENPSDKVDAINDSNSTSTVKYPSVKALVTYVNSLGGGDEYVANKVKTITSSNIDETHYPSTQALVDYFNSHKTELTWQGYTIGEFDGVEKYQPINRVTPLGNHNPNNEGTEYIDSPFPSTDGTYKSLPYISKYKTGTETTNNEKIGIRYTAVIILTSDYGDYGIYRIRISSRGASDGGFWGQVFCLANNRTAYSEPYVMINVEDGTAIAEWGIKKKAAYTTDVENYLNREYGYVNKGKVKCWGNVYILSESIEYGCVYRMSFETGKSTVDVLNHYVSEQICATEYPTGWTYGRFFDYNIKDVQDANNKTLVTKGIAIIPVTDVIDSEGNSLVKDGVATIPDAGGTDVAGLTDAEVKTLVTNFAISKT